MTFPAATADALAARPEGERWSRALLPLLIAVPIVFNAVFLWPEVTLTVPSLNDDAVHYLLIQRASEALSSGESLVDHWVPELELGFPTFRYYQHLPHVAVVLLHRLLLGHVELYTLFNVVRYLILIGFPLVVYWAMRRMHFSPAAAVAGAAASSLLACAKGYGFEYGSYIWRGHGTYTQLWAMPLSFVALACLYRVVEEGKGYASAVVACSALALSHLLYTYMMGISVLVLLLVGLRPATLRSRIGRLALVGGLVAVITAYMSVPILLGRAYLGWSPYLQRWKYDSFGAADVLWGLVDGDLLDGARLPVLTTVLALGVVAAWLSRTRQARLALALFAVWLLLYFGRATWGPLADLLPMHEGLLYHRFVGGVHLAAILLIGLGGEWLWRQLAPLPLRWRALAAGLAAVVLLAPALAERRDHYGLNAQWMERARLAIAGDDDARAILAALHQLPPGRAYAGLREDWGRSLAFGDLHFPDLFTFERIPAVTPPYSSLSLNADLIWHFSDRDPAHYELMNARYVVAPRSWSPPAFLRSLRQTGRYVLYEAPTLGYGALVSIAREDASGSQTRLFLDNRSWFQSGDVGAGRFVKHWFPSPGGTGVADAAGTPPASTACLGGGGVVSDELVQPGRIDLRTDCASPATLALKVTYHPNWRVAVDGREVPAFMISPSFIGVNVPAGAHAVRAEYRSGLLKPLLIVVGGLALLATIVFRRRLGDVERLWSRAPAPGRTAGTAVRATRRDGLARPRPGRGGDAKESA